MTYFRSFKMARRLSRWGSLLRILFLFNSDLFKLATFYA